MKKTPFYRFHQELGAKIVPFAGYEMPIQYTGIIEEHKRVRNSVGVFDVSHMGEFFVSGKGAAAYLQQLTLNDVTKLFPGRIQYSAMCYDDGGIIDDLLIYNLAQDKYMVVVNASNMEKDFAWMKEHLTADVTLKDESDQTALLAVQGPKAEATLQKLTTAVLSQIQYYHFVQGTLAGVSMIISRTGYTGEAGFELYCAPTDAEKVWTAVFEAGKEFGIGPVGLGARDTLRLEMGFCLYGNDIDQTTNPLEAGLGWITRMSKPVFVGKAALEAVKSAGLKRKLVGLMLPEKTVARHGYPIRANGAVVGVVTSGTFSPTLEKAIAMGYVEAAYAGPGTTVAVDIRGTEKPASVVTIPFLNKK
ncbi:MAG: glycine cleavage system aminomethyltransferase GcvT [Ignavibacteriales bacterium]|nr:glycine cleavage system aminomethyltransferase GcvT [Ignavibacteriales bacterium]